MQVKCIEETLLNDITEQAQQNGRFRMNHNFHQSLDSSVQRMLNALEPDTVVPIHRHRDKEETYIVLRGSIEAMFYNNDGEVIEQFVLDPTQGKYGVHIPADTWHNLKSLEKGTVIFEIKEGPYQPLTPEDIAPWG